MRHNTFAAILFFAGCFSDEGNDSDSGDSAGDGMDADSGADDGTDSGSDDGTEEPTGGAGSGGGDSGTDVGTGDDTGMGTGGATDTGDDSTDTGDDSTDTGAGSTDTGAGSTDTGADPDPKGPGQTCDPIDDVCTEGYACLYDLRFIDNQNVGWWTCQTFFTPPAEYGDPCLSDNECEPIGVCSGVHGACQAPSCCTVFCHIGESECSDGMTCENIWGAPTVPENVGACFL
jgi:hypothetical protein